MPKYDQLLLEFGGGVINAHSQSEAYKKDACVAIGIGGTGIAALKRLKKNVYQQLIPDDPEAPDLAFPLQEDDPWETTEH